MRFYDEPRPDEVDGKLTPLLRESWEEGFARKQVATPDSAPNETALAAWITASLLSLALGLGLAKYSQAWAQELLHPAAILGTAIVVVSVALALVASVRYLASGAQAATGRGASLTLATLSMVLVASLALVAVNVIWLAGWELPVAGPR